MANLSEIGELSGKISSDNGLSGSLSSKNTSLSGTVSSVSDVARYTGEYEVTPKAFEEQTLETKNKLLTDNVTVLEIPIHKTTNQSGGETVYIA